MRIDEIMQPNQNDQKIVKKIAGNKAELADPKKPGITTTVDLDKTDIDTDEKGNTIIDTDKKGIGSKNQIRPNAKVVMKWN